MKTIAEIHVANLDELARPFGSQRQFAIHLGKDPKQVNQWWGKGSARGIGPTLARELEERFSKPRGWLDNDHSQWERLSGPIIARAMEVARQSLADRDIDFDPAADFDVLAQAIRAVIADEFGDERGRNGPTQRVGQAGGTGRTAGPAKARDEGRATAGRSRKRAAGGS